jgi:hypothetical protein
MRFVAPLRHHGGMGAEHRPDPEPPCDDVLVSQEDRYGRTLPAARAVGIHHLRDEEGPAELVVAWVAQKIGLTEEDGMIGSRVAFIAAVVDDLSGSYNTAGQQSWWTRPRTELGNLSPIDVLAQDFDPAAEPASAVAELARSLHG